MSSIEPNEDRGSIDTGEKIYSTLVVTGCERAELLQLAEEILDEVALGKESPVIGTWVLAAGHGWDHRRLAGAQERLDHPFVGIEGFVGQERVGLHLR